MQPVIEETFCKPAGFLFKQIIPSCKPFILLLRFFAGSFSVCQDYFSPEACRAFLCKQKFAVCSRDKQQSLARDSLVPSCSLQPMHLLATEILLRERRTLHKSQHCRSPRLHKIPAKIKESPLVSLSGQPSWKQPLPSTAQPDLPKDDKLLLMISRAFQSQGYPYPRSRVMNQRFSQQPPLIKIESCCSVPGKRFLLQLPLRPEIWGLMHTAEFYGVPVQIVHSSRARALLPLWQTPLLELCCRHPQPATSCCKLTAPALQYFFWFLNSRLFSLNNCTVLERESQKVKLRCMLCWGLLTQHY